MQEQLLHMNLSRGMGGFSSQTPGGQLSDSDKTLSPPRASEVTSVQKSNTHSLGSSCSQPPDKEAQRRHLAWVCLALVKPCFHKTASAILQGLLPEDSHWHHHVQILFSFRISTHGAWGQKATGKVACVESMKAWI